MESDKDKQIKEDMDKLQEQLKKHAIGINYVQEKFKKRFIEIAKEEYSNDYGVTLKELIKLHDGYFPKGNEEIEVKLDLLADEIKKLRDEFNIHMESQSENPDTPEGYHKSADGSKLIKDS